MYFVAVVFKKYTVSSAKKGVPEVIQLWNCDQKKFIMAHSDMSVSGQRSVRSFYCGLGKYFSLFLSLFSLEIKCNG